MTAATKRLEAGAVSGASGNEMETEAQPSAQAPKRGAERAGGVTVSDGGSPPKKQPAVSTERTESTSMEKDTPPAQDSTPAPAAAGKSLELLKALGGPSGRAMAAALEEPAGPYSGSQSPRSYRDSVAATEVRCCTLHGSAQHHSQASPWPFRLGQVMIA